MLKKRSLKPFYTLKIFISNLIWTRIDLENERLKILKGPRNPPPWGHLGTKFFEPIEDQFSSYFGRNKNVSRKISNFEI